MKRLGKYISIFAHGTLMFLPWPVKRFFINRFLGGEIHKTARIGFSYVAAKKIVLKEHATIKSFNIIRNLEVLELSEHASIGSSNYVSAVPLDLKSYFGRSPGRIPALKLGQHTSVTKKHFFDCNDTIVIGDFTTIAGHGTAFFTHGINLKENCQEASPIKVGSYCMIATCCVLIKGAQLPDYSVLGANSTLHKSQTEPYRIYSGVPAVAVASLDENFAYFHRKIGYVS